MKKLNAVQKSRLRAAVKAKKRCRERIVAELERREYRRFARASARAARTASKIPYRWAEHSRRQELMKRYADERAAATAARKASQLRALRLPESVDMGTGL